MSTYKLAVLLILDGWGIAPPSKGNAITSTPTPNFDALQKNYPHSSLLASEEAVGLPKGEFGNSETGHLNIGAGYIVPQSGTALPHPQVENPLARIISQQGLTQFHLAESEKFPHVTYFFNGGQEEPFDGEEWIEVPSPKVSTYDQKPEMSAWEVTQVLIERIASEKFNFILVNYANPDMVGHTGNLKAGCKAIATVDRCLGQVVTAVSKQKGFLLVTADHGNAEIMINPQTGAVDTTNSTSPVPCIAVAPDLKNNQSVYLRDGILADITPTILASLGIPQPAVMTGKNLVAKVQV